MAHVILGLLLIAPRSYYDLIKGFEAGVALFYSASSGSIKRAINKLLAEAAIAITSSEEGGRRRTVYRVTDDGQERFEAWMQADLTESDADTAVLSRLYFLGLLEEADRGAVLERITNRIAADLAALTALDEHLDSQQAPAEYLEVARYQRVTLEYGIAAHGFALEWFAGLTERK